MGDGQALYAWLALAWRDLLAAALIGGYCGLVAHIGRLRRGDQVRTGIPCLIADCAIAMMAGDVALLACISTDAPIPATVLAIFGAGYIGQAFLDRVVRRWIMQAEETQKPPPDG